MSETASPAQVEELTPRQREVLALLARGATNFEIAQALGISLEGAKYHVREITGRLGVATREEAADWWREQRRPAARLRRGFGWFLPRLAVAGAILASLALTAVVVAVGVGAVGGGKPAPAYIAGCQEGDLAMTMDSELRNTDPAAVPEVRVYVRFKPTAGDCYAGGDLTVAPDPDVLGEFFSAAPIDTVLRGEVSTTFVIGNWCGGAQPFELKAQLRGASVQEMVDHPVAPCPEFAHPTFCLIAESLAPCPIGEPAISELRTAGQGVMEFLDKCNPQRLRIAIDPNPQPLPLPAGWPTTPPPEADWRLRALYENTAFALTWAVADRPLDCEYEGSVTVRVLDAAGEEIPVDTEGGSVHRRFRRATLPVDGTRMVHVPGTGGGGDYSTETTSISYSEGSTWVWANWCGEDRSPATVEVTSAAGRVTAQVERPPCLDANESSAVFRVS